MGFVIMQVIPELGFPLNIYTILFWLLVFAIVYGLLETAKLPRHRATRGITSLVISFLVLPAAGWIVPFIEKLTSAAIIAIMGVLTFMIMLEVFSIRKEVEEEVVTPEGKKIPQKVKRPLYVTHWKLFSVVAIIIGALVFFSAGGLEVFGLKIGELGMGKIAFPRLQMQTILAIGFIIIVIALVIWMLVSKEEREVTEYPEVRIF